jgi:hypothetical protein
MTYFFKGWWVTKVKPDINSVEVHPQLSHNGHLQFDYIQLHFPSQYAVRPGVESHSVKAANILITLCLFKNDFMLISHWPKN